MIPTWVMVATMLLTLSCASSQSQQTDETSKADQDLEEFGAEDDANFSEEDSNAGGNDANASYDEYGNQASQSDDAAYNSDDNMAYDSEGNQENSSEDNQAYDDDSQGVNYGQAVNNAEDENYGDDSSNNAEANAQGNYGALAANGTNTAANSNTASGNGNLLGNYGSEPVADPGAPVNPTAVPEGTETALTDPAMAAPETPPAVDQAASAPVDAAPAMADAVPVLGELRWVGYNYKRGDKALEVEIIAEGQPKYEVFQEKNQAEQPELVIRLFGTKLRPKIRRDIDASEFRSPVAYIRMREDVADGHVDVVLTMRDPVQPTMFEEKGNFRLTYAIPDRYYGNTNVAEADQVALAELLANANVLPVSDQASAPADAQPYVPDNTQGAFSGVPEGAGNPVSTTPENAAGIDGAGLPADFGQSAPEAGATDYELPPELTDSGSNGAGEDTGGNEMAPANEEAPVDGELGPEDDEIDAATENYDAAALDQAKNDDAFLAQFKSEAFSIGAVAQDNYEATFDDATPAANATAGSEASINAVASGAVPAAQGDSEAAAAAPDASLAAPGNASAPSNPAAATDTGTAANAGGNSAPVAGFVVDETGYDGAAPGNAAAGAGAVPVAGYDGATDTVGIDSEAPQQTFSGRPISIEFYKASLASVLAVIQEESGNNFVFTDEVGSGISITTKVEGVPWDEFLKAVLETYGLGMVQIGERLIRVDKIENMTSYLKLLNASDKEKRMLAKTKVLVVRLNHAEAKTVAAQLASFFAKDEQLRGHIVQITFDDRTNSVIVEGHPVILAKTKGVIDKLDLITPQAEIAARIIEVTRSNANFLGIRWTDNLNFDPSNGLGFGSLNFPNSMTSSFTVDPGVQGTPREGFMSLKFGSLNKFFDLDLLLRLEEKKGTTNVLQSNRVLVIDRKPATIISGTSQFFNVAAITQAGQGVNQQIQQQAQQIEFNLKLDVTPQISADGLINMDLKITSDTPADPQGTSLIGKNTRELTTFMSRKSGETGVIGGIYDTNRVESVRGIPFLSDLPIIGALFRSKEVTEKQTELLIMVTPTVVSASDGAASTPVDEAGGVSAAASTPVNASAQSGNFGSEESSGSNYGNYGGEQSSNGNYGGNQAANEYGGNQSSNSNYGGNQAANEYGGNSNSNYGEGNSSEQSADQNAAYDYGEDNGAANEYAEGGNEESGNAGENYGNESSNGYNETVDDFGSGEDY